MNENESKNFRTQRTGSATLAVPWNVNRTLQLYKTMRIPPYWSSKHVYIRHCIPP
jgi:hypothetical protein